METSYTVLDHRYEPDANEALSRLVMFLYDHGVVRPKGRVKYFGPFENIQYSYATNNDYKQLFFTATDEHSKFVKYLAYQYGSQKWRISSTNNIINYKKFEEFFYKEYNQSPSYKDWGIFFDLDIEKKGYIYEMDFISYRNIKINDH